MFRPPFSTEEFFAVFSAYNESIWPFQVLLVGAAVAAAALAVFRGDRSSPWIWGILSVLWVWTGVVYHVLHFTAINPAAFAFGALFVAQGALLFWRGVARGSLPFRARRDASGAAGGALIVYALAIYPLLGLLTGHGFFDSPTFGAPCPVVIYTFGMLLLSAVGADQEHVADERDRELRLLDLHPIRNEGDLDSCLLGGDVALPFGCRLSGNDAECAGSGVLAEVDGLWTPQDLHPLHIHEGTLDHGGPAVIDAVMKNRRRRIEAVVAPVAAHAADHDGGLSHLRQDLDRRGKKLHVLDPAQSAAE